MRIMSGYVRRARRSDAKQIAELRLTAYKHARDFQLSEEAPMLWTSMDEQFVVLAAWERDGQAISTTRGEVYNGYEAAEQAMECAWDASPADFPALLLGKGATLRRYQGTGLHSALRYYLLSAARNSPIRSLMGIVFENAPRTRLMARIGYEFKVPDAIWYTDLRTPRRTLIGILRGQSFGAACSELSAEIGETLKAYPLVETNLTADLSELCVQRRSRARL